MSYNAMQEQLDVCREINAHLVKKLAAINAAIAKLGNDDWGDGDCREACGHIDSILNRKEVNKNDPEHQTQRS